MAFEALDIIFIIAYFILVFIVGIRAYFKETKEAFLIAGRKLNFFLNSSSITSSKFGSGIVLVMTAFAFIYGFQSLFFIVGAVVGVLVFLLFAIKLKKQADKEKFYTLADYFKSNYGKSIGYLAAICSLIIMIALFLMQTIGGAKVAQDVLGIPYFLGIIILLVPVTIYISLGGFKSVVDTDLVQIICMLIIFPILAIFFFSNLPALANYEFQSLNIGMIIGFLLIGIVTPLGSTELWQRVYAAKDIKTLKKSFYLAAFLFILIAGIIMLIGIQLRAVLPLYTDQEVILLRGIQMLPSGIFGIGIIALFAAIMSSADTYLFTNAAILSRDFLPRKLFSVKKMRIIILLLSTVTLVLSLFLKTLTESMFFVAAYASIIASVICFSFIKGNKKGLKFGLILGLVGTTIFAFFGIDQFLIIKAIVLTLIGYLVGGIYDTLLRKKGSKKL
ncbi:MAG: hypothetical protein IB618_01375 [Candidatus Pacearchaeota archaeon]|nr:MAG: hypothetical protein IB618_01375 [Candidatus Pacearchaeota archaeon]